MSEAALVIRQFGHFEVVSRGTPIPASRWPLRKVQNLLKILLITPGQVCTQDQLVEWLFPGRDADSAIKDLYRRISELRRTLEPQLKRGQSSRYILRTGAGYCFNKGAAYWLDTEAFEQGLLEAHNLKESNQWEAALTRFQEALSLYQGEYLAEDLYEEWSLAPRERWRERYLAALEGTAECQAHFGKLSQAADTCQHALSVDGYHERFYRQLMQYYGWMGEANQARQTFERCERMLAELGVEPDLDTQVLLQRIEQHQLPQPPIQSSERAPHRLVTTPSKPASSSKPVAEQRQLTAMICRISRASDRGKQIHTRRPSDLQRAYREACLPILRRYEGTLVKHAPEELLICFGYPHAHEDDAQRAVCAALAMHKAVALLNQQQKACHSQLSLQIGVHTGAVLVKGEVQAIQDLDAETTPVFQLAQNLAERASPVETLISDSCFHLVGGYFQCSAMQTSQRRDAGEPMVFHRVVRERGFKGRFELSMSRGLTPLTGRREELALLQHNWKQVDEGKGRVILLAGEAGVGKSRLVYEFQESLKSQGLQTWICHGFAHYRQSAFHAVTECLGQALRLDESVLSDQKLKRLEAAVLKWDLGKDTALPVLASLLSLPCSHETTAQQASPEQIRQQTLKTLLLLIHAQAKDRPLLFIVEDLHWVDPSTLEFLSMVVEQIPTSKVLALFSYRPEQFQSPWHGQAHVIPLTLGALSTAETTAMAQCLSDTALSGQLLDQLAYKSDGIPLFVEELMRALKAFKPGQDEVRHAQVLERLPDAVPKSLKGLITSRLDQLGQKKELLQVCAVLGREFPYDWLEAAAEAAPQTVQAGVQTLIGEEMLYQRGFIPHAHLMFRHALFQEATYESLPAEKRRQLHGTVASILERDESGVVESSPELIAHHYSEASLPERAIPLLLKAGKLATQHSANQEAIVDLTKALALLESLSPSPERDMRELELLLALGPPLMVTKGYAAPELEKTFARAYELCERFADSPQLFSAIWLLSTFYGTRGQLDKGQRMADSMLRIARRQNQPLQLALAHMSVGWNRMMIGEFHRAREHMEEVLHLYDPFQHRSQLLISAQDPAVSALSWLAWILWFLGYPDQALQRSTEAFALARKLDHRFTLGFAVSIAGVSFFQLRREVEQVKHWTDGLLKIGTEEGFALLMAAAPLYQGWLLIQAGKMSQGVDQMRHGLAIWEKTGMGNFRAHHRAFLAEGYIKHGRLEEAVQVLNEAHGIIKSSGERFCEAELQRLKGEVLELQGSAEAETTFRRALQIAHDQHAHSLELRAAMSLSRFLGHGGRKGEALELLRQAYGKFTEGFETADLQGASELLKVLEQA